jgi:RNA polymerase sigma-70 factor (ECF subfamily)
MNESSRRSSDSPPAGGAPPVRGERAPAEAHPLAPSEDLALVRRLLSRDESAFQGLIEQYHGRLLRLALAFVADRSVAEEVVQETWLAVLNGLPRFEGRSTLKTWIFRILTNRAKTRGTREARSVSFSSLMDGAEGQEPAVEPARFTADGMWADPPRPWKEETPEDLLLRSEALAVAQRALAELPAGQRAVVTLRDIEGLSSEETCNTLEISETNQRVLLHRGRAKVRRALEQYLGRS